MTWRAARVPVLVSLLSGAGCDAPPSEPRPRGDVTAPWRMPLRPFCEGSYTSLPAVRGRLEGNALVEVSGVVASPTNPDVLWMHNDSGDDARLFAVAVSGALLGELRLGSVEARDLEDLAAAPCPDASGPCLWVADTGDNEQLRDDAIVYAVAEPAVSVSVSVGTLTPDALWRFPVEYPGGPVDVEAIVALPDGSGFFLFEKIDADAARVFRSPAPLVDDLPLLLEEVGRIPSPGVAIAHGRKITGADLHPSGRALVVRVYTGVFEYSLANVDDLLRLDEIEPFTVTLGPLTEPQGEAVAYDEIGLGLWTVSEDPEGNGGQPLHHYACE